MLQTLRPSGLSCEGLLQIALVLDHGAGVLCADGDVGLSS